MLKRRHRGSGTACLSGARARPHLTDMVKCEVVLLVPHVLGVNLMSVRDIVIFPDDRLRAPTKKVTEFDDQLKALVQDMFDSMYYYDGIGLAAPQIGVSKRLVVIDIPDSDEQGNVLEHHQKVLVNPEITFKEGLVDSSEGCLSVPETNETVQRAERIKFKYQDLEGNEHEEEADGLWAICVQHELDHLSGHLFIDYLGTFKRDRIKKRLVQFKKEHDIN